MSKKGFRARVAAAATATYPSLLEEGGRRSFLRALGAGLLGAAVGSVASSCESTSTLAGHPVPRDSAGLPDIPSQQDLPFHGSEGLRPDVWSHWVDGSPRPPDLWVECADGVPSMDASVDLAPQDASTEAAADSGAPLEDGTRPELGTRP